MSNESTLILLKCKLFTLRGGLQRAIENKSSKETIRKWQNGCLITREKILDLEQCMNCED